MERPGGAGRWAKMIDSPWCDDGTFYETGGDALSGVRGMLAGYEPGPHLHGRMRQAAEDTERALGGWSGEPLRVVGRSLDEYVYLLPDRQAMCFQPGPPRYGRMTWADYERDERARGKEREAARQLGGMLRSLRRANADGITEIDDPEDYCRRALAAGRTYGDLLHCLDGLRLGAGLPTWRDVLRRG